MVHRRHRVSKNCVNGSLRQPARQLNNMMVGNPGGYIAWFCMSGAGDLAIHFVVAVLLHELHIGVGSQ